MPLVLEYPFRLFLYIVVILVLISIMWQFRDQIMGICLFPPCKEEVGCVVKPVVTTESALSKDILEKYCRMCWGKNREGGCDEDALCYVINVDSPAIPSQVSLELDYCSVTCDRGVTSVFVQYDYLDEEIIITC